MSGASGFISDKDFTPDAAAAPAAAPIQPAGFIPDNDFVSDEQKFGGAGGALESAALGAADALTLGGASQFLTKSGLAEPQTLKGIQETSPVSNFAGSALGLGIAHLYGVGEAEDAIAASRAALKAATKTGNALEIARATEAYSAVKNSMGAGDLLNPVKAISKIGGKVGEAVPGIPGIIASAATEGALFGVGQTVSEQALGDPDSVAESLMHNMGYGAFIGGGLGAVLGVGAKAVSKIPDAAGAANKAYKDASSVVDQILSGVPRGSAPIVDPIIPPGSAPSSVDELLEKHAKAIAAGEDVALPEHGALVDAVSRQGAGLENPPLPIQVNSLLDQSKRDNLNIIREMPGDVGDALRGELARQKNELVQKTDQTIAALSPGMEPTQDAAEGGARAAKALTSVVQEEDKRLLPALKSIKEYQTEDPMAHQMGVIKSFTDKFPGISQMFDTNKRGVIKLLPYDSGSGIDRATYNAVREAFGALQKPSDVERLMNIRKAMAQHVDLTAGGEAAGQIKTLRAGMLDYIQKEIEKVDPFIAEARQNIAESQKLGRPIRDQAAADATHIRDTLKGWAVNQQNKEIISDALGVTLDSDNIAKAISHAPEKVLDKVFRNSETVKAAREFLGQEKFNEVLANYLSKERALVTDQGKNTFSSNKFYSNVLSPKRYAVDEAFRNNGEVGQRIKDLNTIMRILPDSAPINPPHTAKTLIGALNLSPMKTLENLQKFGADRFAEHQAIDEFNKNLSGTADRVRALTTMQKIQNKVQGQISSGIKGIFNASEKSTGFLSSKLVPEEKRKDALKFANQLNSLNGNPSAMMTKLTSATEDLYPAAPQVTAAAHTLAIRATQFLASKAPQSPPDGPLSAPVQPSAAQLATFDRYRQAVDDPVAALGNIKNGLLSNEEMETLQVVYPKLLMGMRQQVISQISKMKDPSQIPFQTKITLSRFMGQPLSASLTPQSLISSQSVYAQPSQQTQNLAQNEANKTNVAELAKSKMASRISLRPNDDMS